MPSERSISSAEECELEEYLQYVVEEQKPEHGALTIPRDEHIALIQEEVPLYEPYSTQNQYMLTNTSTLNIIPSSMDQHYENPCIYHSTYANRFEPSTHQHITIDEILLNEEVQVIN